jgi:hypothetical protein
MPPTHSAAMASAAAVRSWPRATRHRSDHAGPASQRASGPMPHRKPGGCSASTAARAAVRLRMFSPPDQGMTPVSARSPRAWQRSPNRSGGIRSVGFQKSRLGVMASLSTLFDGRSALGSTVGRDTIRNVRTASESGPARAATCLGAARSVLAGPANRVRRRLLGRCHLNRPIERLLERVGLGPVELWIGHLVHGLRFALPLPRPRSRMRAHAGSNARR